ncbi:DUF5753 domain-containing protein (plasmid) [Amycolatopsis sp. FU40]|uniref:DUF5753 domain-containing protein n=1 Tax=Amycolatopsis sp. FU40 TaxID=2914159 RepID=UPI001F42E773|nr:DUF5753 domain-containing protein [Amycolatopsis sp. FU40]UKD50842.1 DUF5753 domain-containing protein [Amycolatopsis sp. FU40]
MSHLTGPHRELVTALTDERLGAGLTGTELGAVHGWGQGKVSKIEGGVTRPSNDDVRAWLSTTSPEMPAVERGRLLELADLVSAGASRWKDIDRDGIAAQQRARGELEAQASLIQIWQPKVFPGLGQKPDYTRYLLRALGRPVDQIEPAVEARQARQQVLYDSRITIEMVILESVLRRRFDAPPEVIVEQIQFLQHLAKLPNAFVGILTDEADKEMLAETSYVIKHGDDFADVRVETRTRELVMSDLSEIEVYENDFKLRKAAAVTGDEAVAVMNRAASYLRTLAQ